MVKQGDIIFIDFSPTKGHEQRGRRPALVVSNNVFNQKSGGLVLLLPITSKSFSHPLRVDIDCQNIKGQLLMSHIRSLDLKNRKYQRVASLDAPTLGYVIGLLKSEF